VNGLPWLSQVNGDDAHVTAAHPRGVRSRTRRWLTRDSFPSSGGRVIPHRTLLLRGRSLAPA
jgi:hypothetical protein